MPKHKHYCVIDSMGYYVTLILASTETNTDNEEDFLAYQYDLQPGQSLILRTDDCRQPTIKIAVGSDGFIRPRWNGTAWVEGATTDEIAQWELDNPAPAAISIATPIENAIEEGLLYD